MGSPSGSSRKKAKRTPRVPAAETDPSLKVRKSVGPKGFPDYASAMAYLKECLNIEQSRPTHVDTAKAFNLDRMVSLMELLGNPQKSFRTIHVAGSKGKGSTCEMAASCLQACGYAVGLYTSPHLIDLSERIRINGRAISNDEFTSALGKAAEAAGRISKKLGEATYFELLTAAGFIHFCDQAVDVAVIEVGMGGRVDATNVIVPQVSAITAIQLEHTHLLGGTLEKIAREKAGIMKKGVPAVTVPQPPAVLAVLKEVAAEVGTTLETLNAEIEFSYRFEASPELGPHARVCLTTPRSNFEHLPVPLKGEHQAHNCGLALAILDRLRERGMDTPEGPVAIGLAKTPSNGRLEQIHLQPRILIDGAHNPESMQALVKAIGAQIRYDSMVVVFGCAADKDVSSILANVALGADKIIFTRAEGNLRAMDPKDLHRKFAEVSGKMAQVSPTLKEALNLAACAVARDDVILVTGSFALAGEAKRLLREKAIERESAKAAAQIDHATLREVKSTFVASLPKQAPRPVAVAKPESKPEAKPETKVSRAGAVREVLSAPILKKNAPASKPAKPRS